MPVWRMLLTRVVRDECRHLHPIRGAIQRRVCSTPRHCATTRARSPTRRATCSTLAMSRSCGDCSILLGNLLALRRRGRHGLLFIDGHADFYQPEAEPNGEAASMDLALATGRGPSVVTDLEGLRPLVRDQDVVQFARRDADDADEAAEAGSQRIEDTGITVIDLRAICERGVERAANDALTHLLRPELDGFWLHVDCDALDDAVMPAVDYRLPGGLQWDELETVIRLAVETGRVVGVEVTIFNPLLDSDGSIAHTLVSCLARSLEVA
jgi:arginase